jgi:hypothetical protein
MGDCVGGPKRRWENNFKMTLKQIPHDGVDWNYMA